MALNYVPSVRVQKFAQYDGTNGAAIFAAFGFPERCSFTVQNGVLTMDTTDIAGVVVLNPTDWVCPEAQSWYTDAQYKAMYAATASLA